VRHASRRLGPTLALIGVLAVVAGCTSRTVGAPTFTAAAASGAASSSGATANTATPTTGDSTLDAPTSSSQSPATSTSPAAPVATVTADPGFGASNLSPAQPIDIKVADGTITSLTFTNNAGKQVDGTLSADRTTWTLGEVLGYGKTYTASGTAVGTDGKQVAIHGTYSTLPSTDEAESSISPGDDDVVGIAQSVIIHFPVEPVDKAEVEKHLTITTTPAVKGGWAWIQHDDGWGVDWRPEGYWPANTRVHVSANLYGLKLADGKYGAQDLTSDFTIGRAQVVYADANSHQIEEKQGCTAPNDEASCTSTVATYPASFGSGDNAEVHDSKRVTRSGIHVVSEKLKVHAMSNPPYYSNVTEYWDVRISDNGEFIHENPNTVADQGFDNVSHGCINLSPANAEAYFTSALIGDPVEITGTSVQLSASDGDMFDYTVPWSEWQNLSALQ
jgi:lipoprotein-anchoring transpeptidase ErfK/SrfK